MKAILAAPGKGSADVRLAKLPYLSYSRERAWCTSLSSRMPNKNTLIPISRWTIEPDRIVYADGFLSYDALDVSEFRRRRINHFERFVEARNDINGIENFWNQAKRHLRRVQ